LDTFRRYVYIHGTNHEENIGRPASSGCLQLSNDDVIELFDQISEGTHLLIQQING
jgi:lipoprotein-anchoring transpeptidase ErfK/SrfK